MLKKLIPLVLCLSTLFYFASCKTNKDAGDGAGEDPSANTELNSDTNNSGNESSASNSNAGKIAEPTPEEINAENQRLLRSLKNARSAARSKGANKLYADQWKDLEKEYAEIEKTVESADGMDYTYELKELAAKYQALGRLAQARDLKQKIDDYGFADTDKVAYSTGTVALEAAEAMIKQDKWEGKEVSASANIAYESYRKILATKFASIAKDERYAALRAKAKAEEVKCQIAAKADYNKAVTTFKHGDNQLATNPETAYDEYHSAKESWLAMAEEIGAKRAAAQAAIERAKNRTEESNAVAEQADKEVPLGNEPVKGIEDENAVLLEESTYEDPEAAKAIINDPAAPNSASEAK